jgi:hypothetical protein
MMRLQLPQLHASLQDTYSRFARPSNRDFVNQLTSANVLVFPLAPAVTIQTKIIRFHATSLVLSLRPFILLPRFSQER